MSKKNSALTPLSVVIGTWNVTMSHVALPHPLLWQDSFDWLEDAFIIWRWQGKNEVPEMTSIISRNENKPKSQYCMFSYDSRGVSRIFEMSYSENTWKFWREDLDFFQSFEGKIGKDGNDIRGKGEISHDSGKNWEHDYDIAYTRIK